MTFQISSPILYDLGLEAALEWLVEQTQEQHGIAATCEGDGRPKPLDTDVSVVLYQATRELLINVTKHSRATKVSVATRRVGDSVTIRVEDDGAGFDPRAGTGPHGSSGYGLFSVRERLAYLGGSVTIDSAPGQGTRVTMTAPLTLEGAQAAPVTEG